MKKIVAINTVNYSSTGNIMLNILNCAKGCGFEVYFACIKNSENQKKDVENQIFIGHKLDNCSRGIVEAVLGLAGFSSFFATRSLLKQFNSIKPDIIHLHNLHSGFINLPMLFRWIKKKNVRVIWTLHDCWSFTGHCPHFDAVGCDKWKTGCFSCPIHKEYPYSKYDNSRYMYKFKKKWFTGVSDMTIVTPSKWLCDLVNESFLKDYDVKVINNGIDLSIFKPIESNLRKDLGIQEKTVILGCAAPWSERKGLDVFIELSKQLDDKYQIILVGTNEEIDKKLPENIISVNRTQNQTELAKYYTIADVFVNPTREDNFPTVNLEALACGTPIITFKTGGSPEPIIENCGIVVPKDDVAKMKAAIEFVGENRPFTNEDCVNRALNYNMNSKFDEYIKLYEGDAKVCNH